MSSKSAFGEPSPTAGRVAPGAEDPPLPTRWWLQPWMAWGALGSHNRRNAIYNLANSVARPLAMVLATPFILSRLGLHVFGIWMLGSTIAGTLGLAGTGLGDATVKYVSSRWAEGDVAGTRRVITTTLGLYCLLGVGVAGIIAAGSPLIAAHVLHVLPGERRMVVQVLQLAGLGMLLRSVQSVFTATLRGLERYDLTAKLTMAETLLTVLTAVALVALGHGPVAILGATAVVTLAGAVAQATVCRRIIPGFMPLPHLDRGTTRLVASFGIYSWLQAVGSILFGQVDRIIVGAVLGVNALAYYAICIQVAQQVHLLSAAAFHFVFPVTSRSIVSRSMGWVRVFYRQMLTLNLVLAVAMSGGIVLFGRWILTVWLGAEFARHTYGLLAVLAGAYALLAINVVPHNVLLGLGKVRYVAATNLAGGVATAIGIGGLAVGMGLVGAGLGNAVYGAVVTLNFLAVSRRLRQIP